MEQKYFEWQEWDEMGVAIFTFYQIKLIQDIGHLKTGQTFDGAYLDLNKGVLEFYELDYGSPKVVAGFDLGFTFTPREV